MECQIRHNCPLDSRSCTQENSQVHFQLYVCSVIIIFTIIIKSTAGADASVKSLKLYDMKQLCRALMLMYRVARNFRYLARESSEEILIFAFQCQETTKQKTQKACY